MWRRRSRCRSRATTWWWICRAVHQCQIARHGRARPGHPRLLCSTKKDVDARHKAGHDGQTTCANIRRSCAYRLIVVPGRSRSGRTRNLEIPGSRYARPGMTVSGGMPHHPPLPRIPHQRDGRKTGHQQHGDVRATCRVLPPALLPLGIGLALKIGLAAAPGRICGLGGRIGLEKEAEEAVALDATVRDEDIGRGRGFARYEAALRLIAQHRDELGAIVGLAAQRRAPCRRWRTRRRRGS
jgi:hypothetical protein